MGPVQGILIKIQCTVTNRSEQSLISTRVRRGLALITPYLQGTIKWIDKLFKREVNFSLAFGQEWFSFIYSFKRNWILLMTGGFFLQRFFQLTVSTRGHLSWLGGWLRGCIHSCVCQQRHTQQHVPPLVKDTAWEGRLLIEIHHTGTLLSLSTQLVTKLSIAMFRVQLSQCRQITASPSGRHVRKEKM